MRSPGRSVPLCALVLAVACGADEVAHHEPAPTLTRSALASSSYYYLRCNATGWGVDDRTRLVPTDRPGVLALTFELAEPWVGANHDDCVVTETSSLNAWGDTQHDHGAGQLFVPTATTLQDLPEGSTRFEVFYPGPGRYRAVLQLAEGSLSIAKAPPYQGGDVAWADTNQALADEQGRLYRVGTWPGSFLSRVDAATGEALWTRPQPENTYSTIACAQGDDVVVNEGGQHVTLLAADSGQVRWSTDLNGQLATDGSSTVVTCRADAPHIIVNVVNVPGQAPHITVVRRDDGAILWTREGQESYSSVDAQLAEGVALLSAYGDQAHFTALDLENGSVRWRRDKPSESGLSVDRSRGRVYVSGTAGVHQLDVRTGAELWSRASTSNWPFVTFEAGFVLLHDDSRLDALDEASGAVRWSVQGPQGTAPNLADTRDGNLAISFTDYTSGRAEATYMRSDGTRAWQRTFTEGNAGLSADQEGRLFVSQQSRLSRLDKESGDALWTFTLPPPSGPQDSVTIGPTDGDARAVYVTTYGPGYRTPPMDIWSLDPATGTVHWMNPLGRTLWVHAQDVERLYVTLAYSGTIAIVK